jgi:small subunit ribosomal protein S5
MKNIVKVKAGEFELKEKLVSVNRVAKVVKGGRRFSFNAIVVVAMLWHIGIGLGKANEYGRCKVRRCEKVRFCPIVMGLFHMRSLESGAGKVMLKPAAPGTGLIAGGGVRAVLEMAGVKDVLTKQMGSPNSHNVVKATMHALLNLSDARMIAERRGISFQELFQ